MCVCLSGCSGIGRREEDRRGGKEKYLFGGDCASRVRGRQMVETSETRDILLYFTSCVSKRGVVQDDRTGYVGVCSEVRVCVCGRRKKL